MTKANGRSKRTRAGNGSIPVVKASKGATLNALYRAAHQAFTAADLQKFTVNEEGVPARQILAELEAIDRKEIRKRSV
jgi:hypothetical protein